MNKTFSNAAFGLGALVYLVIHVQAGLSLPVPWPDELHFILPAQSLVERGTLVVPMLHPDRALMWMPPGYAVVLAPVVAMFGPSLVAARWLSCAAAVAAAGGLLALLRPRVGPIIATAVVLLLMLHPAFIVMGNVARMESCVLALVLGGFALLARDRLISGVALLALAPLMHPHGLPFLATGAVVAFVRRRHVEPPNRWEWALAGLAAVAWATYAVMVAAQFDAFLEDMTFQFTRKAGREVLPSLLGTKTLMLAGLLVALLYRRRRGEVAWIAAVAVPAWSVQRFGHEMWYHPFDALVSALVVATGAVLLRDLWFGVQARGRPIGVASAAIIALGAALAAAMHKDRPRWPSAIRWRNMTMSDQPYLAAGEIDAVRRAISERSPARIEVFPRADAVWLLDVEEIELVDPVRLERPIDARVYHRAPQHPKHWRRRVDRAIAQAREEGRTVHGLYRNGEVQWWWVASGPPQ